MVIYQYHDYPSFADVSIICKKISSCYAFLGKKYTFFPTNSMKAVLKVFQFCFRFQLDKRRIFIEIYKPYTICPESRFKVAANWTKIRKVTMTSQLAYRISLSNFCWHRRVSLNSFTQWSKFHVNLTIISQVMTILIYKGFEQNSRNCEKALSEICSILGDRIWHECV